MRLVPAAGGGELVFIALLEAFQTRADLRCQALGEGDLVLQEERVGLQVLVIVGRGAGQRGSGWP